MDLLWLLSRIIGIVIIIDMYVHRKPIGDMQLIMLLLFIIESIVAKIEKGAKK